MSDITARFKDTKRDVGTKLASSLADAPSTTCKNNGESDVQSVVEQTAQHLSHVAELLNSKVGVNVFGDSGVRKDIGIAIADTMPLLYKLSLQLLSRQAARRARQAASKGPKPVDLAFDRVDYRATPLGYIVDAAIGAAIPKSLLASQPLVQAVDKLSIVLKEQLQSFDHRRLQLFRIMQERLALYDKVNCTTIDNGQTVFGF